MIKRRHLALALASLTIVAGACSSSTGAEVEFTDTPTAVSITSGVGNVSVANADSGATVTAELSFSGDEPIWTADFVGGELVINDGCGDRTDCTVNLVVAVAGTADVTITSAGGAITVVDTNSTLAISGTANNVVLNGITGPINVDLQAGDLLGARLVSTDATFKTGSGSLDVTLTEVFGNLTVISGAGDVTAQVPRGDYEIDATTGSGAVDVKVNHVEGATAKIVMRTESGDVQIYRR